MRSVWEEKCCRQNSFASEGSRASCSSYVLRRASFSGWLVSEGLLYVLAVGIIFFLFGVARGKERLCLKAGEEFLSYSWEMGIGVYVFPDESVNIQ